MRLLSPRKLLFTVPALVAALGAFASGACQDVPVDNGSGSRIIPPAGVIQGTVLYQGPHPCTRDGHVVGNLILLFFNQSDPPPPAGIATTAVNFGSVSGDVLFQNEPRQAGSAKYCPLDQGNTATITASAPFAVSPFAAGTYIVEAFFDYTGDFLPTFKFRELPEQGDVAGGYIDTTDALLHMDAGVDYKPIFFPVVVGVPAGSVDAGPDAAQGIGPDGGGPLVLPPTGFVANNVTVSVGDVLPIPRPYFYVSGATAPAGTSMKTPANPSGDPSYVPAQTMAQDIQILAQPPIADITPADIATFQNSLTSMKFLAGVPAGELNSAISPNGPFQFQLTPAGASTSLYAWTDGTSVPESTLIANLLPQIVFTKLIDDPGHTLDPQGVIQQVPPNGPVVIVLGLNMGPAASLLDLVGYPIKAPGPMAATDHINALVRPVAVCIDPTQPENGATLVTPYFNGPSADPKTKGTVSLFDQATVVAALEPIFGNINAPVEGCLPPGRYAANFVYPTGQAWTVPNESGSCSSGEGPLTFSKTAPSGATCASIPGVSSRDVLFSQGPRAVLEITKSEGSARCAAKPVPKACGGP